MTKTEVSAELPYSSFPGTLDMAGVELDCHVLIDGRRVFSQRAVVKFLSGAGTGDLKRYIERIPNINNKLVLAPIEFRIPGSSLTGVGREATDLVEICEAYLTARDGGLLHPSQMKLAAQAEILIRASAKVGIIALIDEATGYQAHRAKNALQLKLQAFIAEEMQDWARMFPSEFWTELARLEGIKYSPRSRPLRWGKYVMTFVYDAIDADVGQELRKVNPDPHYRQNHHQWLQTFGKDRLRSQLDRVITVMKLCDNMDDFRKKFAHVFKKTPLQLGFEDIAQ